QVARHARNAVAVTAAQVGPDQHVGHHGGIGGAHALGGEGAGDEAREVVVVDAERGHAMSLNLLSQKFSMATFMLEHPSLSLTHQGGGDRRRAPLVVARPCRGHSKTGQRACSAGAMALATAFPPPLWGRDREGGCTRLRSRVTQYHYQAGTFSFACTGK